MIDVAARAGVSQATVSRVVNRQPGVSDEIVEQVQEAIEALGYTVRTTTRRAGSGIDAQRLALVVVDDHYLRHVDVFNAILGGVHRAVNRSESSLLFVQSSDPDVVRARLEEYQADGLLLAGTDLSPEMEQALADLPAVWLSSYHDSEGDHIVAGNEAIGRLAGTYLVETRGHRELAYLVTGTSYPAYRIRRQAFEFYAFSQQVTTHVIQGASKFRMHETDDFLPELEAHARELVDGLVALDPLPTGVFVPFDLLTALVYRELATRNIRIGQDLEIVSCNNQPTCLAGLSPRPATIDIGAATIGTHAVEQLLWRMRYTDDARNLQLLVEPTLVAGELLRGPWSEPA